MNHRSTMTRRPTEPTLDISDKKTWVKAHMLLQHFPGTLTEIGDSIHG